MVKSRDFGIGKSAVQFFACARHLTTIIAMHSTRKYEKEGGSERDRERDSEKDRASPLRQPSAEQGWLTPAQAPCTQMVKSRDSGIGTSAVQFFACARPLKTRITMHAKQNYEKEGGSERDRGRESERDRALSPPTA